MNNSISFLCDFGYESGYGHLLRSISIAEELVKLNKKIKINIFLTSNNKKDKLIKDKFLGENIFNWIYLNFSQYRQESFEQNFSLLLKKENSKILILDTRIFLSKYFFSSLKSENISLVTIDDISEKRIFSDLCFYPPVDSALKLNWKNYKGKVFIGWQWIALRKEFIESSKIKKSYQNISINNIDILLLTGASDPKGISLKVLEFLNQTIFYNINLSIVIGPANKNRQKIKELKDSFKYKIKIFDPDINISKIMKKNHIVISTFGTTCYELAALSIPSIHICLDEDHVKSSKLFTDSQMSISLGRYDLISKEYFKKKVSSFIQNKDDLLKIRESCKNNIDIFGSRNIAKEIIALI